MGSGRREGGFGTPVEDEVLTEGEVGVGLLLEDDVDEAEVGGEDVIGENRRGPRRLVGPGVTRPLEHTIQLSDLLLYNIPRRFGLDFTPTATATYLSRT